MLQITSQTTKDEKEYIPFAPFLKIISFFRPLCVDTFPVGSQETLCSPYFSIPSQLRNSLSQEDAGTVVANWMVAL